MNPPFPDPRKLVAALVLATACVVAVQAGRHCATPKGAASPSKRVLARSHGKPSNPIWIVEYMDFQCGNCRQAAPMMEKYVRAHPDDIYFEVRFFPLIRTHRLSLKSAIYAECAARQGRFWPMYRMLFAHQRDWEDAKDPDALFLGYAKEIGADADRLYACVSDPAAKAAVLEEREKARSLGLTSTPTFFVDGKKVVGVEALREELDARFPEKPR